MLCVCVCGVRWDERCVLTQFLTTGFTKIPTSIGGKLVEAEAWNFKFSTWVARTWLFKLSPAALQDQKWWGPGFWNGGES